MAEAFILPNGVKVTCSGDQAERYRAKGLAEKKKPAPKKSKPEPKSDDSE